MDQFKQYILVYHNQMDKEGKITGKTFRMLPLSNDTAYLQGEYDLKASKLVLCSKLIKEELQTIPKMSPEGDYMMAKNVKPGNPPYLFERRMLPELWEAHIDNTQGIDELIKLTCVNSDTFKYQEIIAKVDINQKPNLITTLS